MARRAKQVSIIAIPPFHVQDAANTISRAREHLANPKMVKALKAHTDGLSKALTGTLAPVKPRMTAKKKGAAW